ncbi:hypothetical protein ACWKSP_38420 [Micromonosporaceae bacterium Da 78-11]
MNDDEYGALLLRPLATEPPVATRINVIEAMRAGRRTRSWKKLTGLTAVVAAAATGGALALTAPAEKPAPDLPPDPAVPAACTAVRLPTGGAVSATVTGGDPSGTYLVGTTNPDAQKDRAVLVWHDGELVATVPQTGRTPVMSDINATGVAVGSTTESPFLAYRYQDGKVTRLPGTGTAKVINNAGTIAGTASTSGLDLPARWSGPDAEPELMRLPPGTLGGQVADIDENGTVTVTLATKTYIEQSYLWFPDGTSRPIDAPKAGKGQTTRFWSAYYRFGWLYGTVATFMTPGASSAGPSSSAEPSFSAEPQGAYSFETPAYRYHVASGTWQKLPEGLDQDLTTSSMGLGAFIGRAIYEFPAPTDKQQDDGFDLISVSDDGRTAGGGSLSNTADPAHPNYPLMWRCT